MFSNGYELRERASSFMSAVYGWMSCGLAITAGTAYYLSMNPMFLLYIYNNPGVLFGLMIAQIVLVFAIAMFITRMSFVMALGLFLIYAFSLGLTLSSIFLVYTQTSILSTFATTAGTFALMSIYGYVTKADLTSMGNLSMMALIGLIIGMVINMFLGSAQFSYILSGIGVVVFVLLTAYDTQKIKQLLNMPLAQEDLKKVSLFGALTLYLDFINLFLFLLRFMGNRRE